MKRNQVYLKSLDELVQDEEVGDVTRFELAGIEFEVIDREINMKALVGFLSEQIEDEVTIRELEKRFVQLKTLCPTGLFIKVDNASENVKLLVENIF